MSDETNPLDIPKDAPKTKMKLRLVRKEQDVDIEDEEGVVKTYTLREMTGAERDRFLNAMGKRMKVEDGQTIGVRVFDNMQANLIGRCLFDSAGKLVPETVIATWPASVQMDLYLACQEMNRLGDQAKAKKD